MRDITGRFNCPSVVLTTLLAERITWVDKDLASFSDVPTALKTIFGRLDDYLQQHPSKPTICNPTYQAEDFGDLITDIQYEKFRETVNSLREKIDCAYDESDRDLSIKYWQDVLGAKFAQGANVLAKSELTEDTSAFDVLIKSDATHDNKIVDFISRVGAWLWTPGLDRPSHMSEPVWKRADYVTDKLNVTAHWSVGKNSPTSNEVIDFELLSRGGGLWFDVTLPDGSSIPDNFFVRWRITNTGTMAIAFGQGRGQIYSPTAGNRRWEPLAYRGVHLAEAFILQRKTNLIVGQSRPFHVVVE